MSSLFNIQHAPDGSMTSGSGAPASTLGKNGDGYVDTATGLLYIKASGVWTVQSLSDGWTRQVTTAAQTFSSTTEADITGIAGFAPSANAVYEFYAKILLQSTATNTGPQPSIFVPTGINDLGFYFLQPIATYISVGYQAGGPATNIASGSAPAANVGYLAHMVGIVAVGGSPGAGNVRPRMRSESTTSVSTRVGSMFAYRQIA